MPSIEEIKKLVTFTRISGEWQVNTVSGNVGGDVKGNVGGDVWGNVGGNVGGFVWGTINGRKWSHELTLKERIQEAIKSGNTDLASKLLEGAEVAAKG